MRKILLPLIILAAGVTLAGCTATPQPTATTTRTVTASASPSSSPTSTPRTDPNAPQGQCADASLGVAVTPDRGGAGAGSVYYDVVFTNTGSSACRLSGYPGVSVVDASGEQLGKAATREGASPAVQTLIPGGHVYAALKAVNMSGGSSPLSGCTVAQGTGWSVYAPHSFARVIVSSSDPVPACSPGPAFLTLTAPVVPGEHP